MLTAQIFQNSLNRTRLTFGALVLVVVPLLMHGNGSADAQPQVITISPTSVDTDVHPGQTTHGTFQVINQGKTDYDFTVYAAPYSAKGENYTPDFNKLPTAPDIIGWFSFSTTKGHITAGQTVTVGYNIAVPVGTQPGDYYAAAFAQTKTAQGSGSSVILNERVGELFYLQVPGKEVQKGSVASWTSSFLQAKPITAELRIANEGSVHYSARVQVLVEDVFGHPKYTLNTSKVILPQTVRRLDIKWDKSPSFGLFKVTGSVNYLGKDHNLSTHYVIVASNKIRFTVGPIILLLIVLLIVSLIRTAMEKFGTKKPASKSAKSGPKTEK